VLGEERGLLELRVWDPGRRRASYLAGRSETSPRRVSAAYPTTLHACSFPNRRTGPGAPSPEHAPLSDDAPVGSGHEFTGSALVTRRRHGSGEGAPGPVRRFGGGWSNENSRSESLPGALRRGRAGGRGRPPRRRPEDRPGSACCRRGWPSSPRAGRRRDPDRCDRRRAPAPRSPPSRARG